MPLLVSVYENKINGKVINKKCFGGIYKGNSSKLWEEVSDYIDNTYDVSFLKNVFIIGDCANWIKSATEYICKSKIVIDKFHFRQAVKILVKNSSEYEKNILDAIYSLNFDKFKQEAMFMISEEMNKTVRENKLRLITYIINNKQGIKNMFCYDLPGCSAEGQISHIYSRRMSTIPCGWSITNVDKMSRMRVLKENKGNIKEYIRKEKELIELDIHQKKAYNIVKESSKKIINNNWVDTSDIINLNKEYEEELREIFKYRSI